MKKILAALLTAGMLLSVAACDNGGNSNSTGTGSDSAAPTESSNDTAAPTESANDTAAPDNTGSSESGAIEGYPASLDDWTGQQFIDYFKSVGVFNDGGDEETWLQDHAIYWTALPVNECAGFWDENGFKNVMILIFKSDLPDSNEEAYNNALATIKDKKVYQPDGWDYGISIDHLVGNVAFSFNESIDEEFIEEMEKAYTELITKLGATADF